MGRGQNTTLNRSWEEVDSNPCEGGFEGFKTAVEEVTADVAEAGELELGGEPKM